MVEHRAAQVGDDALAERDNEVVFMPWWVNPKSIMRRTASGTASVASAATRRAARAASARPR
jgi:hypothetical protein